MRSLITTSYTDHHAKYWLHGVLSSPHFQNAYEDFGLCNCCLQHKYISLATRAEKANLVPLCVTSGFMLGHSVPQVKQLEETNRTLLMKSLKDEHAIKQIPLQCKQVPLLMFSAPYDYHCHRSICFASCAFSQC